jgi:hypothetical protein
MRRVVVTEPGRAVIDPWRQPENLAREDAQIIPP